MSLDENIMKQGYNGLIEKLVSNAEIHIRGSCSHSIIPFKTKVCNITKRLSFN
jgi:hypothetical protein